MTKSKSANPGRRREDAVAPGDCAGERVHNRKAHTASCSLSGISPFRVQFDERLLLFLIDMLGCPEERKLLHALRKDPENDELREVYLDFLKDKGRTIGIELVESGWVPGEL